MSALKTFVILFLTLSVGLNLYLAFAYVTADPLLYLESTRTGLFAMYSALAMMSAFFAGSIMMPMPFDKKKKNNIASAPDTGATSSNNEDGNSYNLPPYANIKRSNLV